MAIMAEDVGAGGAADVADQDGEVLDAQLREAVETRTAELKEALEKERNWRKEDVKKLKAQLRDVPEDFDRSRWDELQAAAREAKEQKLKEEARWDELRQQLKAEHDAELAIRDREIERRDREIHRRVVENELRTSLTNAGVLPEYLEPVQAMLEKRGPKVVNGGGEYRGVFPDELHGDKPIGEYVSEWAETEAALPFLKASGATGGGASGRQSSAGGGQAPTWEQIQKMSVSERAALQEDMGFDEYMKLIPR